MQKEKGKGQILNHSAKVLFVLETDFGPPIVHRLGPKKKSPLSVDVDGFMRADGESILLHSSCWKIPDNYKADIYQVGDDFLIPISVMLPVPDKHFGEYEIREEIDWGEKMSYVTGVLKDKQGKTQGYLVDGRGEVSVEEDIRLAMAGEVDNVVVVTDKNGGSFLRTKKNATSEDNFSV